MKRYQLQSGYTLVETLVAISILLIAFVGPITIATKSLQSSFFAREQVTATFLAQEGIEAIASIRNDGAISAVRIGDPAHFWGWANSSGTYADCFAASGCNMHNLSGGGRNVQSCSDIEDCRLYFDDRTDSISRYVMSDTTDATATPYTRIIKLVEDGDVVYVSSEVSWESRVFGGADKTITLHSAVYNIYGQ